MLERLKEIIEEQRKGKEGTPEYGIGAQLLDMAKSDERAADILITDLQTKEMNLTAAAARLKKYADDNHKKATCFCITPDVADKILREFYALPDAKPQRPDQNEKPGQFIDLSTYL